MKSFDLMIMCATPSGALKCLLPTIETVAIRPDHGIELRHRLRKDLRMNDEDILHILKLIEQKFNCLDYQVFGNDESWKQLKTVGDIINKLVAFNQRQIDLNKEDLLRFVGNDEGAIKAIELIAKRDNLIEENVDLKLGDDLVSLKADSLDAIQMMSEIDYIFVGQPTTESMFRKDWSGIKTIGDMVYDMKSYVAKKIAA